MAAIFTPDMDGDGLANANAYLTLAFTNQYHEDRGHAFWATATDADKQTAIVRATFYVDKRFGRKWRGVRADQDQALDWPRIGAYDNDDFPLDAIPRKLRWAVAEYALRALIYQTLAPDPLRPVPTQDMSDTTNPNQQTEVITGQVKSKKVQVGPISESTTYESATDVLAKNVAAGTRAAQATIMNDFHIPEYPEADLFIEELIKGSASSVTLVRS